MSPAPPHDAGNRPLDAAHAGPSSDAGRPDVAPHPADAAPIDDDAGDADSGSDAEVRRDLCGNVLPASAAASGVVDGSVTVLPAIAQQPAVRARGPAFSAEVDGRVLWVFDAARAQTDGSTVVARNSYALSNLEHPFVLDEASATLPPMTWLPELPEDQAAAGASAQLSYALGNPLVLPLSGPLLFYAVSASVDATTRTLGTRVVRLSGTAPVAVEPVAGLLFSDTQTSFHTGVLGSDGRLYLYGCATNDVARYDCKLARVQFGSVGDPSAYQFRAIGGWSNDATAAIVVVEGLSATLSVSYNPYLEAYLLASFVPRTNRITLRRATRPEGPWTELGGVDVPTSANATGLPAYAAEHPELSSNCGKGLLLTYLAPTTGDQAELRPIQVELR